jgi:hypothetical protein
MGPIWLLSSGRRGQHCSLRRADRGTGRGRVLFFAIISAIFEAMGLRLRA